MAITYLELAKSRDTTRELTSANVTLRWIAMRETNEEAVYAGLVGPAGVAPLYRDGMRRGSVRLKHEGLGVWNCEVDYKWSSQTENPTDDKDNPDKPLGPEWSFDGTAATTHVTQSIKTKVKAGDPVVFPGAVPDYQQAIGVTKDSVQGADIRTHQMEGTLTLTRRFITPAYIGTVYRLCGKTNKKKFFSWAVSEVLFLGASINVQPDQAKVSLKFGFGENLTNIDITPTLRVSRKDAWDYIWCGYQPSKNNGVLVEVAVAAYVEQVYREADLNDLLD